MKKGSMHSTQRLIRLLILLTAWICASSDPSCAGVDVNESSTQINTGRYATWEDAPASIEEFDHDNNEDICRLPIISLKKWEAGKFWLYNQPFIVTNVTDDWPALRRWTKDEFLRHYPDVVVGMGTSRELGQTGPDDAGDALSKTTINDYVFNWMHNMKRDNYVFDRKLNMPDGLLEDCQPYPQPLRHFVEDPLSVFNSDLPNNFLWKDHLALTIGRDQQGLTFHRHNAALNIVVFGAKRWILYDAERFSQNITRLKRMTRDIDNPIQLSTPNWFRELYNKNERQEEIRNYGHDCVQRAGEMLYVPRGWAHMVINIGDSVAVVSERGLDA